MGYSGTILRTTDGGSSWTGQASATVYDLNAVSFTDGNTGTVVGSGGTILRTTDGGSSWTPQSSGRTNHLRGVSFTDANTGTAVGWDGTILRTTDGGTNWTVQSSGTTYVLSSVCFTDANTGTAVGAGGTILRTNTGGITDVREEVAPVVPSHYSLMQNFPNPFNPSTEISYSLPKASSVTIRIFDILGREVTTLINQRKEVGRYVVSWNAEGYPSGIYFYRLTAGDFFETRKMVLMK